MYYYEVVCVRCCDIFSEYLMENWIKLSFVHFMKGIQYAIL